MKNCQIANHELYTLYENGEIHSGISDYTLNPRINSNGYAVVKLNGEQLLVHRLVALHFLPNPYGHPQVNHKDGNKTNNHVSNLEWCSAEQNINHSLKTGLRKGFIHVDVKRALLKRVLNGETALEVSKELTSTHPNTLNRMLRQQAIKDGLENEWSEEAKRKRKLTAIRNLEKVNNASN